MSVRPGEPASDPYGGRRPTSHERQAGRPWDASYQDGPPPWDINEPQPAVVRLVAEGGFAGAVLDSGCGTGENALHVASLGLPVVGIDVAPTAVALAQEKATSRGLDAEFVVADAFGLDRLGRTFETVLDCGLFHTFEEDAERRDYLTSLASVTERGAKLHVLCFSDLGPADRIGPHPIGRDELEATFDAGNSWSLTTIRPDTLKTSFDTAAPAWSVTAVRT